jgi:hypothetical protein
VVRRAISLVVTLGDSIGSPSATLRIASMIAAGAVSLSRKPLAPAPSARATWIDLWTSQQPLFKGGNITGDQWSQIATSTVLWVVLPFVFGLARVLRAEVK